jgi:soluble lytic murein transglycosylase-like protein
MTNMRKLLEAVDSMKKAEKKPTGPKFPGYWKGTDPASKSKTKMVGSAEESVLKDLHNTAKQKVTEWALEEAYRQFNENNPDNVVPSTPPTTNPQAKTTKPAKPVPPMPKDPAVGSWQEIWQNNPDIKNPHLIHPGQQIKMPYDGGTYTVQKGDTLSGIAAGPAGLHGGQSATRSVKGPQLQMPSHIISQIPGVESGNNPNAVSSKGAVGAWQTMPSTLRDPGFGVAPARDTSAAESNRVGQDYAHAMFNRYSGDAEKALAAYNAGPGRVDQALRMASEKGGDWKSYLPHETQAYIPKFNLAPPDQVAMKENEELARHHDVSHFAKLLRNIESREQVDEYENAQDPNAQVTSQPDATGSKATSMDQQAAADKEQAVDVATAKGTMSGLKTVLGPKVDTNTLASAVTKISDGQPLTAPEATSMSALTPLISKAAETPQTAMSLKTALSNAAMLAKQGK